MGYVNEDFACGRGNGWDGGEMNGRVGVGDGYGHVSFGDGRRKIGGHGCGEVVKLVSGGGNEVC